MSRSSNIKRETKETQIEVVLELDGQGNAEISTGIDFFDHMLNGFTKHGFYDMKLKAVGDLDVDGHHTVEDTGIVLGKAIAEAVGDKKGICRYGSFILPMDDALVLCSVDLCGRPYYSSDAVFTEQYCGKFETTLVQEFFYAVSYSAAMNIHFKIMSGHNAHHIIEAMFKAFAKALDIATSIEPRANGVLSTKGTL